MYYLNEPALPVSCRKIKTEFVENFQSLYSDVQGLAFSFTKVQNIFFHQVFP